MPKSFLQSQLWGEFQQSLGRKVFAYNNDGIKAIAIRMPIRFGKAYLHIPYGPEMDFNLMKKGIGNSVSRFAYWLRKTAKQNKAIFIKAEPMDDNVAEVLAGNAFKKSKINIEPRKTVAINLSLAKDELLGSMHHKTRYNIRIAQRKGVEVRQGEDIDDFWRLMKRTAKRDRFRAHPRHYYEKLFEFYKDKKGAKIELWYAYYQNKPVAAAMVFRYEDTGYYLHGASDYEFRSIMAPYALHWNIMLQLRACGLRLYDMWGIDARKWPGVTRFKLGWGGKVVEYPGAFDISVSRFWHFMYRRFRRR